MFKLDLEQEVSATAFRPEPDIILHQVKFEIDFYTKKSNPKSEFNSDDMVQEIQPIYDQLILQTGHKFPFKFKGTFFLLTVKEIKCVKMKEQGKVIPIEAAYGVWQQNRTSVQFMRSPESLLNLTGKAVSMTGNIINPDFDFSKVGIGGLDEEFKGKIIPYGDES